MATLDYVVMLFFTLGVLAAGMSFSRSGKNMKTFFAGGGEVPWWINGLSLFMSFFSAGTFVAWGSLAYIHGWVSVGIQWTMSLAGFIIAAFIAVKWRNTGVLTGAQFIGVRLGEGVKKTYTYLFMAISVFTSGAFLYPVAKIVEGATGYPFEYIVIFLALVIVLYTATGGLWAVIVTDVLQFVILTAAVIIIVPLAFDKVGGLEGFLKGSPEGFFSFTTDEITPLFFIGFGLYNLVFIAGNWAYVQRYTSVKGPREARKVALLFGCLYTISPIIWMLPPMIYRIHNPSLDIAGGEANHAYMFMSREVLPVGLLGLMVGSMIFATASSVNTTLNIVSGVFTNDIYKSFKPTASDKQLIFVARSSTTFFGLLTMVIALLVDRMGGILNVIWAVGAVSGGAMYVPMLWALFSKRHNAKSVLGTTLICLVVNAFFKWSGVYVLTQAQSQALGTLLPLALMAAYELAASRRGTISRDYEIYESSRRERELSELIKPDLNPNTETLLENRHGIKVIGIGILTIGILIGLLGVYAENGAVLVSSVGGVVGLAGVILLRLKNSNA
ncbi:MAG: Na+:solute symporter [Verrucomicrobia bacterium]|nr:Na+:solute symporter [Verrucomicrobiota bacterium]